MPQQGTSDGEKIAEDIAKKFKVLIKGDRWILMFGDEKYESIMRIDPSKSPTWIDLIPTDDKTSPGTSGIYKLDGNALTVCHRAILDKEPPPERPKAFKTKKGRGGGVLIVWKRVDR